MSTSFPRRVVTTGLNIVGYCFCIAILAVLYMLEPIRRIRLIWMIDDRIGHLAINTDVFVRRMQLDGKPARTSYIFLSSNPANRQLLDMWKRVLPVVESRLLRRLMLPGWALIQKTRFYQDIYVSAAEHREYALGKSVLTFTAEEEERGRRLLAEMGIGPTDWFICFHARDPAYIASRKGFGQTVQERKYRDCSINNYLKAAEYVASLGGFAIRMGALVAEPLAETGNSRIIDYATKYRSDFMDIYLSAKCRFFLGSNSGMFIASLLFDVPVGAANWCPLCYTGIGPSMYITPMLLSRRGQNSPLSFPEIRALGFMSVRREDERRCNQPKTYDEEGLEWLESEPDDILDLCKDLIDRDEGRPLPESSERLMQAYKAFFPAEHPHAGPYSGPINPRFALKYRHLILPESGTPATSAVAEVSSL